MGDLPGVMDGESRDVTRSRQVLFRCVDAFAASSRLCALASIHHVKRLRDVTARVRCMELVSRVVRHPPEGIVARGEDVRGAIGLMGDPPRVVDRESRDLTRRPGALSRCPDRCYHILT